MIKIRKSEIRTASLQKAIIQDNGLKHTNKGPKGMLSLFWYTVHFLGFTKVGTLYSLKKTATRQNAILSATIKRQIMALPRMWLPLKPSCLFHSFM